MKKHIYFIAGLLLLPFALAAQSLPQAEQAFADGDFASALSQYDGIIQTAAGNDLLQAQLRKAACQYGLGEYLNAYKTMYGYSLPENDVWKARFLLYRVYMAQRASTLYRPLLNDGEILTEAAKKDPEQWTKKQWDEHIDQDYQTLWALRAALINAPIEKENLILNLKDADVQRIPTLFDFTAQSWITHLQGTDSETVPLAREEHSFLDGAALLNKSRQRAKNDALIAEVMETAYLLDGKNRQNAQIFWKTDYIKLPFNNSAFEIKNKKQALENAVTQLNLLSGRTDGQKSWWNKLKGYVTPSPSTAYARGYAALQTARLQFENGQAPQALQTCEFALDTLPPSAFTQECGDLKKKITQVSLNIPNLNAPLHRVAPQLEITGRNLHNAYLRIYKTSFDELTALYNKAHLRGTLNSWDYLTRLEETSVPVFLDRTPLYKQTLQVPYQEVYKGQKAVFKLPELEPGFYVAAASYDENFDPETAPVKAIVLNASDLAFFTTAAIEGDPADYTAVLGAKTKNLRPNTFHVYTVNLKTGEPEPAAQLNMFTSWQGGRQRAQTDEQGYAAFQRPVTVSTDNRHNNPYILNTLAKKDGSTAFSDRTLYFNFYNNDPVKLYAQTDRPVYRPGQKVRLSVNAFQTLPRGLKTLSGRRITFTVKDPNYKTVFTANPVLNELGTAQAEMTLPESDLLGRYEVLASLSAEGRTYRSYHSFTTEEYKRPDYELTLAEPEKALEYGKSAVITGAAKYYFGSPLQNAQVKYTVERREYVPPFYWWLRISRHSSETVAQGETKTDEKGAFKVEFTPAEPDKNEDFSEYVVKAEAFDESGRAINTSRSYKISTKPHLFQVEFTQGFYDANTPGALAKVNLTDADGHGVSGKITLEAVRLKNEIPARESAQPEEEYSDDDYEKPVRIYRGDTDSNTLDTIYKNAKTEASAFKQELNFKNSGEQTVRMPALPEGVYRLKLSSAKAATQQMIFVVAEKNSALKLPEITLVQYPKYFPGETMRVLLGDGELKGSKRVEIYQDGGRFLYQKDLLPGGVSIYSLPVTEKLRGGVTLAWFGASGYELFYDTASAEVPFDNKELAVTFTPPQTVRPGENVSWKLSAKNAVGAPINGQANITVYDKSLDYYVKNNPSLTFTDLYSQKTGSADTSLSNAFARSTVFNKVPAETESRLEQAELPSINLQMRRHVYGIYKSMNTVRSAAPMMAAGAFRKEAAVEEEAAFDTAAGFVYGASRSAEVMEDGAVLSSTSQEMENGAAPQETVTPRTDFSETAYFNSQLPVTGGQAAVKFTMPQSLTSWNIFGFVLTQTADFGAFTAQTVTKKDFMVRLQTPRFYREGDKGVIQAAVTNLTDKKLSVQVTLSVQKEGKNALAAFGLTSTPKTATVAANSTQFVTWETVAPSDPALYTLTATARSGKTADAEQKTLPVLPGKMRLLATVNKALKNGANTLTLAELSGVNPKEVETVALTVNPSLALSVLSSMPNLLTSPYKDLVSSLNRYVPLAVVNKFYTTYPQLKEAVKKLPKRDGQTASWDENDPLRLTLLEQTPWLRQAQGRKAHTVDIIDLFNAQTVEKTLSKELKQIAKFQNTSGAFTWFAGGPDDDYLTLYALSSFAQALSYNAKIPQAESKKAFSYIVPKIEKRLLEDKEGSEGAVSYALYAAYTLSSFPAEWAQMSEAKPYIKRWADYADAQSRFMTPLGQIYAAAVYHRLGDDVKAARYLNLVLSRMKQDELAGAYFAPEPQSWIWYNDTLTTQTVTLKTLLEMRPDSDKIDPMTQWLLFNRQVNDWTDSKAAAQAVFTLLDVMKAKGALSLPTTYNINWAGEQKTLKFEPFDWTKDLQFTRSGSEITSAAFTAEVSKQSAMTDFASLSAVYQTSDAKASPKGVINVSREYYLRKKQGDEVQLRPIKDLSEVTVGDEVDVRLTLSTNSAFEYVHLQDPKPAGFESEELLSGWEWGNVRFYRENRDAATNFFINWLPNGTVTLHYILRPTVPGKFHALPAQAQSMYAPEFGAHSDSETLNVIK